MSVAKSIREALVPIHRDGWKFIAIALVVSVLLGLIWSGLLWLGLIITGWICYFFRDPKRVVPIEEGLVVSPADGKISQIAPVVPPAELELGTERLIRVSVFMNVFNCHINRAPVTGKVARVAYTPGKFMNAELDKASEFNERNGLVIESAAGLVGVVQVAGLVARRIVCNVIENDDISIGERFGLIRFGSRLDVFLPEDSKILVSIGQTMIAGETIIANLNSDNLGPYPNRID